ncbi:50S ribosomal protein acetyltransferase [Rubellimicrobium mesophilum DSM 19309]|uniref:50S ribosomal protein acetyltransferase n=1 Tax=Rubellimicrobium mesophilum DSM 19309 TaxID=442562 RepID=A0A017HIK9_9RHOB|nr:GNAT family N-acetyltransferase [Rubellimicrobium mesophilum]EYD73599.1 50S ribosomal protein acetyltransferase [Rubellimicrobium mesophilum DSM 19309]
MRVLRTARLALRPIEEADLSTLVERINDFEIARWLSVVPFPYTQADAKWFLAHARDDAGKVWVIDDGQLRGIIGLGHEFGYWLERGAWGRGLATEAGRAVLGWHFAQPGAGEVFAGHFLGNDRSANVLAKLGFEPVGLRLSPCRARGHEVHSRLMRLTPDRWASRA